MESKAHTFHVLCLVLPHVFHYLLKSFLQFIYEMKVDGENDFVFLERLRQVSIQVSEPSVDTAHNGLHSRWRFCTSIDAAPEEFVLRFKRRAVYGPT